MQQPVTHHFKVIQHRGNKVIMSIFPYQKELKEEMKTLGARYSRTHYGWYFPFSEKQVSQLQKHYPQADWPQFKDRYPPRKEKNTSPLDQETLSLVQNFEQYLKAKNYSYNSIKNYISIIKTYISLTFPQHLERQVFINYMAQMKDRKYSASTLRQMTASVNKFWHFMGKTPLDETTFELPRPKRGLPKVLSKVDIKRIFDQLHNLKHKAIVSTLYSTGIRISELIALRIDDIDGDRNTLRIRDAKGNKDRYLPFSPLLKTLLRRYYIQYSPRTYLFEGAKGPGTPYSPSSVNALLKNAAARAALNKPVSAHVLRHSFATHLLESGVSLRHIQEMLGHRSSRTTEIYTQVTTQDLQNISNPLDRLFDSTQQDLPF